MIYVAPFDLRNEGRTASSCRCNMKSLFLKMFVGVVAGASAASALSLYDTAPVVGLPESHVAQYFFTLNGGYDTNPSGATERKTKEAGEYVNASFSASFADNESIDKMSCSARLGGTHYLGSPTGNGRKYYSDSSLDATLSHAFSAMSRYTGSIHLSYLPEPGYDNGYSSAGMQGDTLSWNFNNSYSEAIDARWSWNAGANVSGTKYSERTYSYDDRQYYSASLGLNYRDSDRLTYTSSASCRYESRSYGLNSQSLFVSGGVQLALDPVSSASVSVGAQCKLMAHKSTGNPTLDAGYRRRVSDGLSLNAYVKYSDENVDNYSRSTDSSYRSSATWRIGAYGTYVLSPDVSYIFRIQSMLTGYDKSTSASMATSKRMSLNPSVTMQYNFTPKIQGNVMAEYTYYCYERGSAESKYTRWKLSAGLSYRF